MIFSCILSFLASELAIENLENQKKNRNFIWGALELY